MPDIIEPTQEKEVVDAPERAEHVGSANDLTDVRLSGFFNIDNPSNTEKQIITDLGCIFEGTDPAEMLLNLRNVENRIGYPQAGVSRLQHVYNFVKLNSQINSLERERDQYGA